MNRRFILSIIGTGLVTGLAAQAQQAGRRYRVGVLMGEPDSGAPELEKVLIDELGRLGFVHGRNLEVRTVYSPRDVAARARELIAFRPDVLIASGALRARTLLSLTRTIPVVFVAADPIADGLVRDLVRPGGNATGVATLNCELMTKLLENLRELAPAARRVVAVTTFRGSTCKPALDALRLEVKAIVHAEDEEALTMQAVLREDPDAILDAGLSAQATSTLAHELRVPIVSLGPSPGVIVSVVRNRVQVVQRHAGLVAKILNGARPGDLPVEFPREFQIAVDLRLAREIGIRVPEAILLRATHLIE